MFECWCIAFRPYQEYPRVAYDLAPLKCNGAAITQPCMEGYGVYDPSPLHVPAERRMFFH